MNFEIGKKIRLLRLSRGMTQEKLAESLCVSAQSVSKWENCVTAPDIQLLPEISVQLGVTIDELFSITDESRLQRIETLLSTSGSTMLIPHSEFENYRQFLVEHKDSSALRGRILTALASLYDRQAEGYKALSAEYALQAIAHEPSNKQNHSALCSAWNGANRDWYADNNHRLIDFYTDFLKTNTDNIPAYQLLLDNLLADNRLEEAENILSAFAKIDSSCRTLWYKAQLLQRKGEFHQAEECISSMTSGFNEDWLAWAYSGDFYARYAKYDNAVKCYKRSIELQPAPKYIDSMLCIAQIGAITKDYTLASEYYRKAATLLKTDWNSDGDMIDELNDMAAHYEHRKIN